MARKRDYYDALGVGRNATADQIRDAYRRLARTYHPDLNDSRDASERFAEVSEAYEVLGDAEKRRVYDRLGHAGVGARPGGSPPGGWTHAGPGADFDVGSIFEEMFGGRGASPFSTTHGRRGEPPRPARPPRGRDIEHTLTTTFMTAALGGHERLRLAGGEGEPPRTVEVRIPAGVEPGARLRLRGRGQPAPTGGEPGDLMLTVEVGGHPWFRREGPNILLDVPVTLAEAALGVTVRVPLLRGSASLRIPPGTGSGRRLRIKGRGVTDDAGGTGDFLAIVQIVAPDTLSDRARQHVEGLAAELKNPRESAPWADIRGDGQG